MSEQLFTELEVNENVAKELGLTAEEYQKILGVLGRVPTYTELGVYSVMWSEHCSYKNSILQLKTLPRSGGRMMVEAGEENAGLMDIGGDYGIAFKIESHNHPSAVEPFQGAATGVGGILRDIFTMGARPIAALNSLRFGNLNNERTKFLLGGVVSGISHYGNCFGVPTVGGEIYFEECYQDNPLVNAMAVGIVHKDKTASAASDGVGNPVFIIGSSTGRDGIHGASLLASREFDEKTEDMRPTVQVGDPFMEKLLVEVTLELINAGVVVGIQDMGAAGISCSTSEMSGKKGLGMKVNLDLVPLREANMSAYEIMLSESQERMLAVIRKGDEEKALAIAKKWDVAMVQIGEVTDTGRLDISRFGKKVCDLPAESLVLGGGAPVNVREAKEPDYIKETRNYSAPTKSNLSTQEEFEKLLTSPTIASKRYIFEQYDSQVRTNTVSIKGDAAVLRIKESPGKGIAVTTDCNSKYVYLNPYHGAMIAVCEAARNVVCVGAEPIGITNCLNFGNPYNPEVYWQFKEAIRGMGDACRKLNTPVTGGNVSFHNESKQYAVFPTPTIGMLGIIDDLNYSMSYNFKNEGDKIYLLGNTRNELGGSEYLKVIHNEIKGDSPQLNLDEEFNLQQTTLGLIRSSLINSAHDCSEGGIAITLAEMSISSDGFGCNVQLQDGQHPFAESQSRIIVTVQSERVNEFENYLKEHNQEYYLLGEVTSNSFSIGNSISSTRENLVSLYENAIPNLMKK
jgi:phosphoribosylformylglycinamidine synthase